MFPSQSVSDISEVSIVEIVVYGVVFFSLLAYKFNAKFIKPLHRTRNYALLC
jgi:hypothetical protein